MHVFLKQKNNFQSGPASARSPRCRETEAGLRSESGVTLLIAVLVMSGLALISVAVATFAVQELRASRAVLSTEPAISAAESAGEEGLWAVKRSGTLVDCTTLTTTPTTLTNGALSNRCKSYSNAVLDLEANKALVFYLYDPNDINGDLDLQGQKVCTQPASSNPAGFLFSSMTIISQSGTTTVTASIVRLDGTVVANQTITPGSTEVISIPAVALCSDGRMKVTLLSTGNVTVNVNTNLGMPNFPTINAGGCAARSALTDCNGSNSEQFNRRINITVPQ